MKISIYHSWLKENPAYEHIIPSDSQTVIWGVVTFNLKRIYQRS
jgi:DNA polymerase V